MRSIEYFYSAHSAFAYLGSARLKEIAVAAGCKIIHRPVNLTEVLKAANPTSFGDCSGAHRAYYFGREIERWAEFRGVAVKGKIPASHANDITLANCMLIAGTMQNIDIGDLAHAMMVAHWRDHADLSNKANLSDYAKSVGLDPRGLLDAAITPEAKEIYEANTREAITRSVFGSPVYFVDGDMFYGQDRLEFVERALQKPFAMNWSHLPRGS